MSEYIEEPDTIRNELMDNGALSGGRMSEYITKCSEGVGINGNRFVVPDYLDTSKEIVRCRDCKYADISYTNAAVTGELHCYGYLVESWDWYNDMPSDGVKVKPDGFCAWGERRTDDN